MRPQAALASWGVRVAGYVLVRYGAGSTDQTVVIATPQLTSLVLYVALGLLMPEPNPDADEIVATVSPGGPATDEQAAAPAGPEPAPSRVGD